MEFVPSSQHLSRSYDLSQETATSSLQYLRTLFSVKGNTTGCSCGWRENVKWAQWGRAGAQWEERTSSLGVLSHNDIILGLAWSHGWLDTCEYLTMKNYLIKLTVRIRYHRICFWDTKEVPPIQVLKTIICDVVLLFLLVPGMEPS